MQPIQLEFKDSTEEISAQLIQEQAIQRYDSKEEYTSTNINYLFYRYFCSHYIKETHADAAIKPSIRHALQWRFR